MNKEAVLSKFDCAVSAYIREMQAQGKSEAYIKSIRYNSKRFREFWINENKDEEDVRDFWYGDFKSYRDSLLEADITRQSACLYLDTLHRVFGYASDEYLESDRLYEKNPVSEKIVRSVKNGQRRPYDQILTDQQVAKLWENIPIAKRGVKVSNWPRNYAIVVLALATELRNMEILDLKLSDLDYEYGEIQVMRGKGNKYRCVDFPKIAQTAVRLYLESGLRPEGLSDDDYLFGTTHKGGQGVFSSGGEWKKGTRTWLTELIRNHVKLVTGVDNVRSHDLRHIGARLDLHNGMRIEELQAKLGHSEMSTTQVYSGRLGTKRKRQTAKQVYKERDMQAARNEMMLKGAV